MNVVCAVLLWLSFAIAQALIGGTRLLFALPAYGVLGVAALLTVFLRRPDVKNRFDNACVVTAVLFTAVIIARAWWSPVVYLARADLLMAPAGLAVYLLSACCVTDPKRRIGLVVALLVLSLIQLGVGAIQFVRGDNFMLFHWEGTLFEFIRSADYAGRASGFYICPNHLAGNLEVVGSLTLAVAVWGRLRGWAKLLLGYLALACFVGLLLTGSRGGFLSAGVAIAVFAALSIVRARAIIPERFSWVLFAVFLAAAVLAAGLLFFGKESAVLQRRARSLFTTNIQDVRPQLWKAAWKQFQLAPLVGTGSGTYFYYGRLLRDPSVQNDPEHVHCDYLELLAEYGLVGAAALLAFLATHLRAGRQDFLASRGAALWGTGSRAVTGGLLSNAAATNIGALAALAGFVAHSVVDFNLHIPVNALLLAWVCGLLANPGRELSAANGAATARARPAVFRALPRVVLPGLGAALLGAAWLFLPGEYFAETSRVALRDGELSRANIAARAGLEVAIDDPNLHFYLGESRLLQGLKVANPLAARSLLESAAEAFMAGSALFPEDTRINLRLGLTLDELSDYAAAEKAYQQALAWDPTSGRVWTYYASHLQRQGLLEQARGAYQRALQLASEPSAREALSRLEPLMPERQPASQP